jgi:rubrerythrin
MKDAVARSIDLESEKVQFLEQMAKKYGLPDIGKAVRCLISYAREHPDKHEAMFGEVRCLDC